MKTEHTSGYTLEKVLQQGHYKHIDFLPSTAFLAPLSLNMCAVDGWYTIRPRAMLAVHG